MENLLRYETDQFGISDKSIHLLKNGLNYKTIGFENIDSIRIQKGKDLKNWLWVLIVGLGLLTYVVYDIIDIVYLFNDNHTFSIYIERLLIPLFPFTLGIYSLIISLRLTMVMIIQIGTKKYHLSLRRLIKSNEYNDFKIAIKRSFPVIEIIE